MRVDATRVSNHIAHRHTRTGIYSDSPLFATRASLHSPPLPSPGHCCCLSRVWWTEGPAVYKTDIQRPPDPRMNRLFNHHDHRFLWRLLLSISLVTRPARTVLCSSPFILNWASVATFAGTKFRLFHSPSKIAPAQQLPSLYHPAPFLTAAGIEQIHSWCLTSATLKTPSSWPAPWKLAIRYVFTPTSRFLKRSWALSPAATCCDLLLPAKQPPSHVCLLTWS